MTNARKFLQWWFVEVLCNKWSTTKPAEIVIFKFYKVVSKHASGEEGDVGSLYNGIYKISSENWLWKSFENRSTFSKVMTKSHKSCFYTRAGSMEFTSTDSSRPVAISDSVLRITRTRRVLQSTAIHSHTCSLRTYLLSLPNCVSIPWHPNISEVICSGEPSRRLFTVLSATV